MARQERCAELLGMKTKGFLFMTTLTTTALAQAPAPIPASWSNTTLATATYVILEPKLEGNTKLISQEQQIGILKAMKTDSAGAIKRRYPAAQFATDPGLSGVIRVTPSLVAPSALVPWAKLNARLDLDLPDGNRVSLLDSFSVLTLWQQGWNAANYAYDRLAQRLP